mmetsp:Transcript_84302/g.219383  ORF Transcript_84302/g.219383 Transcript_84302/m.219383 type:complete len:277 (-) Transcript_84302:60-890(-)
MNLCSELAGWRKHKAAWHRLGSPPTAGVGRRTAAKKRFKARNHETTCLATACLRASHQIPTGHDDGDRVLLHGRRSLVAASAQVIEQGLCKLRVREALDGFQTIDVVACDLHRDGIVIVEVDTRGGTCLLLPEDLDLRLVLSAWAAAVLAVFPIATTISARLGSGFSVVIASASLAALSAVPAFAAALASAIALSTLCWRWAVVPEAIEAPTAAAAATARVASAVPAVLLAAAAAFTPVLGWRCRRVTAAAGLAALLGWDVSRHLTFFPSRLLSWV